jgi:hypothetical protein
MRALCRRGTNLRGEPMAELNVALVLGAGTVLVLGLVKGLRREPSVAQDHSHRNQASEGTAC